LVGAVGVAEGRVTARALPHGEAWRAPVIINRCRSLLAAQFAPGSGTAFDRGENGYGVPSQVSPPRGRSARGIAADARSPGLRLRSLSPGEGKGGPASAQILISCPAAGRCRHRPDQKPIAPQAHTLPCGLARALRILGRRPPHLNIAAGAPQPATAGPADQPG
jgi:hypothetical protein